MDKTINLSKFYKATYKQPYLIWNDLEVKEEDDDTSLQFSFDMNIKDMPKNIAAVQARTFRDISSKFIELHNNNEACLIIGMKKEDRFRETLKALKNPTINKIINGFLSFEHEGFTVESNFDLFDKDKSKISFFKPSTSTKRKDYIQFILAKEVFSKNGVDIQDASLYLLATKEYAKNEITFIETNKISKQKNGDNYSGLMLDFNFAEAQLNKTGYGVGSRGTSKTPFKINDIMNNPQKLDLNSPMTIIDRAIYGYDKELNELSIEDMELDALEFRSLLEKLGKPHPDLASNVWTKKDRIAGRTPDSEIYTLLTTMKDGEVRITNKLLINQTINSLKGKIVWYDFEAMSLPIPVAKMTMPFQQVVTQVSTIITNMGKEVSNKNLVIDTSKLDLSVDYVNVIESVYSGGADKWVVYNCGYENTRLKEMIGWLKYNDHPRVADLEKMVSTIIANTVDLLDLFKGKMPAILIKDLKGFSSIKYLEKFINKHYPQIAVGVKDYKSLNIQNGMMALEAANERYLGLIGDNKWNEIIQHLKVYCENDVRAMIMVYNFIKKIRV